MIVTIDSTEGRPSRVRVTTDDGSTHEFMPTGSATRLMDQAFRDGYEAGLASLESR